MISLGVFLITLLVSSCFSFLFLGLIFIAILDWHKWTPDVKNYRTRCYELVMISFVQSMVSCSYRLQKSEAHK